MTRNPVSKETVPSATPTLSDKFATEEGVRKNENFPPPQTLSNSLSPDRKKRESRKSIFLISPPPPLPLPNYQRANASALSIRSRTTWYPDHPPLPSGAELLDSRQTCAPLRPSPNATELPPGQTPALPNRDRTTRHTCTSCPPPCCCRTPDQATA